MNSMQARWSEGVYLVGVDGLTYASEDGMSWIRVDTGEDDAPEGCIHLVGGPMHGVEVA